MKKILQAKTIKVDAGDISTVHRVGGPGDRGRPVIVRFYHRKKINETMIKKKQLNNKGIYRNIFVNEGLTPLKASLLKIPKEQDGVTNVTTRDGRTVAWLRD